MRPEVLLTCSRSLLKWLPPRKLKPRMHPYPKIYKTIRPWSQYCQSHFVDYGKRCDTAEIGCTHASISVQMILKRIHTSQTSLHDETIASAGRLTGVLAPLHLANNELECLEYVLVVACARFDPGALELFGESFAVFGRDLAFLGAEVRLVAFDNNRDPLAILGGVYGQSLCRAP
jgi:hypothetical protein